MERIAHMIRKGAAQLSDAEVEDLAQEVQRHPYHQAAQMLYVQALHTRHSPLYGAARRQAAIVIPDRAALCALIESRREYDDTDASSKPRKAGADRTDSLISNFLDTLPAEKPRHLTKADAATDYMAYLLQNEAEEERAATASPQMAGQSLIDNFIGQRQEGRMVLQDRSEDEMLLPDAPENDEYFTETMAHIYIKQGKYEKAAKIIERLNAKYPGKNAYFADQMRFLRLLIKNNNLNNK